MSTFWGEKDSWWHKEFSSSSLKGASQICSSALNFYTSGPDTVLGAVPSPTPGTSSGGANNGIDPCAELVNNNTRARTWALHDTAANSGKAHSTTVATGPAMGLPMPPPLLSTTGSSNLQLGMLPAIDRLLSPQRHHLGQFLNTSLSQRPKEPREWRASRDIY